MSNTGKKIVLTLKQINSTTFAPTGLTETNTIGTPEYIPPYNSFDCAISNSLSCPLPIFSGFSGSIGFEFSTFTSVSSNPLVTSVNVQAISQSISRGNTQFILPNGTPNYFSGSIGSLSHGSYTLNIQYLSGSTALTNCASTSSISVS